MKPADHTTRGLLFICLCLLAGLIIYLFISRSAQPSAAAPANDTQIAAMDPTEGMDLPSASAKQPAPDEMEAPSPSPAAEEGSDVDRMDRIDLAATNSPQTVCNGSWSAQPNGEANISLYPGLNGSGMYEIKRDGHLVDRGQFVAAEDGATTFDSQNKAFAIRCHGDKALVSVTRGSEQTMTDVMYSVGV